VIETKTQKTENSLLHGNASCSCFVRYTVFSTIKASGNEDIEDCQWKSLLHLVGCPSMLTSLHKKRLAERNSVLTDVRIWTDRSWCVWGFVSVHCSKETKSPFSDQTIIADKYWFTASVSQQKPIELSWAWAAGANKLTLQKYVIHFGINRFFVNEWWGRNSLQHRHASEQQVTKSYSSWRQSQNKLLTEWLKSVTIVANAVAACI
jgi:hypothetical protein